MTGKCNSCDANLVLDMADSKNCITCDVPIGNFEDLPSSPAKPGWSRLTHRARLPLIGGIGGSLGPLKIKEYAAPVGRSAQSPLSSRSTPRKQACFTSCRSNTSSRATLRGMEVATVVTKDPPLTTLLIMEELSSVITPIQEEMILVLQAASQKSLV